MRFIIALSMVVMTLLAIPYSAAADEVVFRDGTVMVGRPTIEGQSIRLVLPTGEERIFPMSRVQKIRHDPGTVPAPGSFAAPVLPRGAMTAGEPMLPPAPGMPGAGLVYERRSLPPVVTAAPPCAPPCAAPDPCDPCEDPCDACKWDGPWSLSLGLSWTQAGGNSDSIAFKADFELTYDQAPWKWVTTGFYAYAESGGSVNTDRFFIDTKVDRDITSRMYAFLKSSFDTDKPANLDYRIIGTGGVGTTILKGSSYELRGEVGAGVTAERRTGLEATLDPSAYVGLDYEKEWVKGGRLVVDYDFLPNLNDFDLSLMRLDVKYELPLSSCLSLRLGFRLDYQFEPVDPTVEKLDWITSAGLSVSF